MTAVQECVYLITRRLLQRDALRRWRLPPLAILDVWHAPLRPSAALVFDIVFYGVKSKRLKELGLENYVND